MCIALCPKSDSFLFLFVPIISDYRGMACVLEQGNEKDNDIRFVVLFIFNNTCSADSTGWLCNCF